MRIFRTVPYIAVLICLALVVTHCEKDPGDSSQDAQITLVSTVSGQVYTVQRGTVTRTLEFDGQITPIEEVPLYFRTNGYVKAVFVQPGDEVERGDVLAELEVEDPEMVSTELNLAAAQARLAQAQRENRYAITRAELALQQAMAELEYIKTQQSSYGNT